jgi:hypothetical protein
MRYGGKRNPVPRDRRLFFAYCPAASVKPLVVRRSLFFIVNRSLTLLIVFA